jgi:hypothetical protein
MLKQGGNYQFGSIIDGKVSSNNSRANSRLFCIDADLNSSVSPCLNGKC